VEQDGRFDQYVDEDEVGRNELSCSCNLQDGTDVVRLNICARDSGEDHAATTK